MAADKKRAGDFGENYAARYLEALGYGIIARNYRSRFGEIDLIAENDRFLLFVEVKTRRRGAMVRGEEAVDARKQEKLRLTAEYYLSREETRLQPRFDVICIELWPNGAVYNVNHYENAF
ncbi:MAG: YraN family protein [Oscillospiraceae bacterium]|nr:YraN family protein [Oscillospiraceae bacterium]